MPKVSVIIPVYNVSTYLSCCLDSVLAQDHHNLEIIIVDDGSTDNSGQICNQYADKDNRIIVIHQDNLGSSLARKVGLSKAQGKYVCFVDSDDWIDDNYVSNSVSIMEENDADVLLCDYYFNENNQDQYRSNCPSNVEPQTLICESLENKIHAGLWCKMFRRDFWVEKNVLFPKYSYYEDMFTWISVLQHHPKTIYLNRATYHYRYNQLSMTNDVEVKKRCEMYKQMAENLQELDHLYHLTNNAAIRKALYVTINSNKKKLVKKYGLMPDFDDSVLKYYRKSYSISAIQNKTDVFFWMVSCLGTLWPWKLRSCLLSIRSCP